MSDAEEPTLALSNIKIAEYEIIAYIVLAAFWFAVVYVVVYKGARMRSRRLRFAALVDEMREAWDASDTIRDASEDGKRMYSDYEWSQAKGFRQRVVPRISPQAHSALQRTISLRSNMEDVACDICGVLCTLESFQMDSRTDLCKNCFDGQRETEKLPFTYLRAVRCVNGFELEEVPFVCMTPLPVRRRTATGPLPGEVCGT